MLKVSNPASIDPNDQRKLDAIPVGDRPVKWDKSKAKAVVNFKSKVLNHGLQIQNNKCVWCTLPVGATGRRTAHRDHIAPKKLYPEWTFYAKNLIVACEYCNGFSVKSDLDTVQIKNADYNRTKFSIVHPYIDNPKRHIRFREKKNGEPGVIIEARTTKGLWTIKNLKLDSEGLTVERAKELCYYRTVRKLPKNYQDLLNRATRRK